jgi:demethylmenaquinone methyltransferase/2-methoxy-6-polyprenyl-1,4-benzoquinol methylase
MFRMSHKGRQIKEMFSGIAPRYDFLNRLLSLGCDIRWRRYAVCKIDYGSEGRILDVATGTGDMALHLAETTPASVSIVGIDFCQEMIDIAKSKTGNSSQPDRLQFAVAPCEMIPFRDCTFDSVTIAFGVRNLDDRRQGLGEIYRVLKTGGKLVILEFSIPRNKIFRSLYQLYFHRILPIIGGLFSKLSAYEYLPESVYQFPPREEFKVHLTRCGFTDVVHEDLTFGIVTVFTGRKWL